MSDWLTEPLPAGWAELGREDAAALVPPDGARERVQRRVALTLGLGAGFLAATAATSTAAAASVATAGAATAGAGGVAGASGGTGAAATGLVGTLLAKKALVLGIAAAVGVGGGTATYLEVRSERARSRAAPVAPSPARQPVARPAEPPASEPSAAEELAPADTLGEERAMLDRARQDIVQGQLAEARGLLGRHAEQFPGGQLAEEREALVIRLLVREGRESEARARAARFRQDHPRSIQLPGIGDALREHR